MEYFLEEFSNETKAIFFFKLPLSVKRAKENSQLVLFDRILFFQITKGRRNDKLIRQITKVVYAKQ